MTLRLGCCFSQEIQWALVQKKLKAELPLILRECR